MTGWDISQRELALLNAALNPDPATAVANWENWSSQIVLESAPATELRLLPATYVHLSRLAPSLRLPTKLRGKARANFSRAQSLAHASLPIIEELGRYSPIMVTKGLAMCLRFDAWAWRPMVDIDIHVPFSALSNACKVLAERGWTPQYGMTWDSLLHRNAHRRDSWNIIKGRAEIDLHWRIFAGRSEDWFARHMWDSGEACEYLGRTLLLQSPEVSFVASLNHGFLQGHRSDLLQTVVDAAWLLPICRRGELFDLIDRAELWEPLEGLNSLFDRTGLADRRSLLPLNQKSTAKNHTAPASTRKVVPAETPLLRRPLLYRLWTMLGRRSRLERFLLRWTGPFSRPLKPAPPRDEYDLRKAAMIDAIGGPGWSWPEAEKKGIWADRADARLLVPLDRSDDYLLVITLSDELRLSPNRFIDVFANGLHAAEIDASRSLSDTTCCVMVTRRMLLGPWVELSFRPRSYPGETTERPLSLNVPVQRLRVLNLRRMNELFSGHNVTQLHLRLFKGEEAYVSKLARIEAKIANSPHKNAPELPGDFDPLLYVLSYPDLFESEVDPYEHFIVSGRTENRAWH